MGRKLRHCRFRRQRKGGATRQAIFLPKEVFADKPTSKTRMRYCIIIGVGKHELFDSFVSLANESKLRHCCFRRQRKGEAVRQANSLREEVFADAPVKQKLQE